MPAKTTFARQWAVPALVLVGVCLAGVFLARAQSPTVPHDALLVDQNAEFLSTQQTQDAERSYRASSSDDRPLRVAVIGGGAGGTSAAFFVSFLAEAAEKDVNIHLFERRDYLGGRSTVIYPFDEEPKVAGAGYQPIEAGASIFVGSNRNLVKAAKTFNLSTMPYGGEKDGGRLGIWDGESMVWEESPSSLGGKWDQLRMLWRYGRAPLQLNSVTQAMIEQYLKLYKREYTETGPHDTVDGMAAAVSQDFRRLPTLTSTDYLIGEKSINALAVNELVEIATRTNYGTDVNIIHALGSLVSLAATNAVSIRGGNRRLYENFAQRSGAKVTLDTEVTTVGEVEAKDGRRSYMLTYKDAANKTASASATEPFDAVIVAAPYGQAGLNLVNSSPVDIPHQAYVHLHVTFIATNASQPSANAFRRKSSDWPVPKTVLSTMMRNVEGHGKRPGFNSLSYLRNIGPRQGVEGEVHMVKMFSEAELSDDYLFSLFDGAANVLWTKRIEWDAYPLLQPIPPPQQYAPFRLGAGLYYANGIERLISCMEVATVGAWNVASLLAKEFWNYQPPASWAEWDLSRDG